MPRALCQPGTLFDVVLESDKDIEPRPTFKARVRTFRETEDTQTQLDGVVIMTDGFPVLEPLVQGWENMPNPKWDPQKPDNGQPQFIPYEPGRLKDIITVGECWELLKKINNNDHVEVDEKKS